MNENTHLVPLPAVNAEALIQKAIDCNIPVESLERLLAMRTQINAENAKSAFLNAVMSFQMECPIITKSKEVMNKGGGVRYRYAPLDMILLQVRDLLAKHGLSYCFLAGDTDKESVTATCKISHIMGHSEVSSFTGFIDPDGFMNRPQRFASAMTFAKRYAFCNALGILTGEDDDDARLAGEPEAEAVSFPQEAEVVTRQSPDENSKVISFIAQVNEMKEASQLTEAVGQYKSLFVNRARQLAVRRAIAAKAEELNFVWQEENNRFA